jgi:outer membrane protein TolC
LVLLWLALILGPGGGHYLSGSEDAGPGPNLADLIQEALRQNPRLHAAEMEWRAAQEKIPQAKALPDPMLSFGHFFSSLETRLGPQRNKLSLSQKLPFFGKLSLQGRIAAEQAAVLESQLAQIRLDITLLVEEAFYSLAWFDEAIRVAQSEKMVLERLAEVARYRYETGSAAQQDALKAQLEITKLADRILTLRQGRRSSVAKLNALLSRPAQSDMGEIGAVPPILLEIGLERLQAWADEARPELNKMNRIIQSHSLRLDLTKKNRWPDLNVMVDYFEIGSGSATVPESGRNAWMASIGINIPLWRGRLRAAEAEAAMRLEASEDVLADLKNDTAARVHELYFEIKTYEEQSRLYELTLIPQAEQALKASEIGYIAGKTDFLSILDAERMLLQLRTALAKLQSDQAKSLARLERVVGREIRGQEEGS